MHRLDLVRLIGGCGKLSGHKVVLPRQDTQLEEATKPITVVRLPLAAGICQVPGVPLLLYVPTPAPVKDA